MKAQSSQQDVLRAARNQALYRTVNEKILDLNRVFDEVAALSGTWVCECADPDCTEMIELTLAEYEALRAHPKRFAVLRHHDYPNIERIVEEHDHWVIVEKLGVGADFAIELDPRTRSRAACPLERIHSRVLR